MKKKIDSKENILSYLKDHVLKLKPINDRSYQYFFVLSDSGIGKTTLLLKLFLEAKRININADKVYFLPLSEWRNIDEIEIDENEKNILILDSMDENFDLHINDKSYPFNERLNHFLEKLKDLTKGFDRIVISSRSQFFRDYEVLKEFTKTLGDDSEYYYKTLVLCPFNKRQRNRYLRKKFKHKRIAYKKAKGIISKLKDNTLNRQLLISNIDLLFGVFESENYFEEANDFLLFKKILDSWKKLEIRKLKKIQYSISERERIHNQVDVFCKTLARKLFLTQDTGNLGYKFEEIDNLKELELIRTKRKILINRSFLILDRDNRYRFAHRSIFDFYLAQLAVEDEVFDNSYFHSYIEQKGNDFAKRMYVQGILWKISSTISELSASELGTDVQYTFSSEEIKNIVMI
ncbi:MAG: hypothetical protein HC831_21085 [Chloroflexia bacterium]|nr:hypothetical protein [Chloroflexia bacterium]